MNGDPISWESIKQGTVAFSCRKLEYLYRLSGESTPSAQQISANAIMEGLTRVKHWTCLTDLTPRCEFRWTPLSEGVVSNICSTYHVIAKQLSCLRNNLYFSRLPNVNEWTLRTTRVPIFKSQRVYSLIRKKCYNCGGISEAWTTSAFSGALIDRGLGWWPDRRLILKNYQKTQALPGNDSQRGNIIFYRGVC